MGTREVQQKSRGEAMGMLGAKFGLVQQGPRFAPTATDLGYEGTRALMKQDGLAGAVFRTPFDRCMGLIALWECMDGPGGHISDHPQDPGQLTVYGLAQATHPWVSRDMTWETAIDAYRDLYWKGRNVDLLAESQAWSLLAFDMVVKHGRGEEVMRRGLGLPGGNAPIDAPFVAVAAGSGAQGLAAVTLERLTYVRSLGDDAWLTFGHGWARRYADVLGGAVARL